METKTQLPYMQQLTEPDGTTTSGTQTRENMTCFLYQNNNIAAVGLGWGLLSQFPPFRCFPNFSESPKHTLAIEYHVYIRQVSPQLSCGDTCQIWMWLKGSNRYFCKIENFAQGEISRQSFSNPHTWALGYLGQHGLILITAWISNYKIVQCGVKLFIHYQTSMFALLKFRMDR